MNPFFSIIIPVYNVESFLYDCLNSILNQSFSNFEIILIDDGSTDNTPAICKKCSEEDERVRAFKNERKGVAAARNIGLDNVSGEYVCFVDGDDWLAENILNELFETIKRAGFPSVVQNGFNKISPGGVIDVRKLEYNNILLKWEELNYKKDYNHAVWAYSIRKDVIEDGAIRFCDGLQFSEDQNFLLKVAANTSQILMTDLVVYNYCRRGDSSVNQGYDHNRAWCQLLAVQDFFDYQEKRKIAHIDKFIEKLLNQLIKDFYVYLGKIGFKRIRWKEMEQKYLEFYNYIESRKTDFRFSLISKSGGAAFELTVKTVYCIDIMYGKFVENFKR